MAAKRSSRSAPLKNSVKLKIKGSNVGIGTAPDDHLSFNKKNKTDGYNPRPSEIDSNTPPPPPPSAPGSDISTSIPNGAYTTVDGINWILENSTESKKSVSVAGPSIASNYYVPGSGATSSGCNSDMTTIEAKDPIKYSEIIQVIEKVAFMLSVSSDSVTNCLRALGVYNDDNGIETIKSLSREYLIRHLNDWSWPNKPSQAQILGSVILLNKGTSSNYDVDQNNDEIKTLSACWDSPELDSKIRRQAGLIDASMIKLPELDPETRKQAGLIDASMVVNNQCPGTSSKDRVLRTKKAVLINETRIPYEPKPLPISKRSQYLYRINEASSILQEKPEDLLSILEQEGIKQLETLDMPFITQGTLIQTFESKCSIKEDKTKFIRAADILKGKKSYGFFQETPQTPAQMDDYSLVHRYSASRELEVSRELDRRSKGQPFVVLTENEDIDTEATIQLLRNSRKRHNTDLIGGVNEDVPVYTIRDMDMANRIIFLCPRCNNAMYKGWCDKCQKIIDAGIQTIIPRPFRLPKSQKNVIVLVQINGRTHSKFQTAPGMSIEHLESEAHIAVQSYIIGKEIKKVIVVPDKIVNLIV